jgi:metal-responsive CopG/Arc/MetJ family transcriptional regulator
MINFVMDPKLIDQVDDFWHEHKFKSRAATITWMIQYTLEQKPVPVIKKKEDEDYE